MHQQKAGGVPGALDALGMTTHNGKAWAGTTTTTLPVGSSGRAIVERWEVTARIYDESDEPNPSRRYGVFVRPAGDLGEHTRRRFTPCAADLPRLVAAALTNPRQF